MKCIVKALQETTFRPRARWWGFIKGDLRYLMRYHHTMLVVCSRTGEILQKFHETKTDKAGVEFAIKFLENRHVSKEETTV